ncbi:hypothetical protein A3K73_03345 [Candidatus Pacearchaeota archaeon RBG_13_36_9]|nr:MAG: hypothetical protein A3K73_03345 [Candidatus Pacearchaeota archaeon RBG_13_36_9]
MKYVIDSWAWIEYLIGSDYGEKVKEIVENKENEVFTCILSIAEIMSMTKRENKDSDSAYNSIVSLSKIYHIDNELSKNAGLLHAEIKKEIKDFGLIDAFILITARELKAKILTGDKHFKNFKEAIFIG